MNARGSTEVIVATIGLSMGIISQTLFTMIVAMAILTTVAMPPMLRAALARLPIGSEEKARLAREEFEEKGFVANLERILLAVDESANGKFASRLAGLIAGARGIPATVLHIGDRAKHQEARRDENESPEAAVKAGAQKTAAVAEQSENQKPAEVEITTRAKEDKAEDAVAAEARKGFDLLVIGVDKVTAPDGTFHADIARVANGFDGPLGIVLAQGDHRDRPTDSAFKILVPITGTGASRRGAEIAVALARANDVPFTALYISVSSEKKGVLRRGAGATRLHDEEILKDLVDLAERYDTAVTTIVRADIAPEEAILREAHNGRYDFIVMGVNRRAGDALFFGNVAAAVLEKAKTSILFVSS
jgi:nucleotide-binding universal stress UspA family protein